MNTNELQTGPELNALVAEKVMGMQRVDEEGFYFWPSSEMIAQLQKRHPDVIAVNYIPTPLYSTDIAAAWPVHQLACSLIFSKRRAYFRALQEQTNTEGLLVAWPDALAVLKDKMPLAICRAALKAVAE